MKILVTGGAGYIGSHACKALARSGYEPISFDNLSAGHRSAVKWGPLIEGDLADMEAIRLAFRNHSVDAVIHFAASAYVGESMQYPQKYFRNNVANTLNLLEVMLERNVGTIVFSSSCATYGVPDRVPILEDHPQKPVNPYGESKLLVERVLRWYGEIHDLRWAALRYFNAAGADSESDIGESHNPETHLIPLAIYAALGRIDALQIFGSDFDTQDGTCLRDFIHVSDLADAHIRALSKLTQDSGSFALNLGTGRGHSVKEVVTCVEKITGNRVPATVTHRRPGDPPVLVADPSCAAATLGWMPKFSDLNNIVHTAYEWHSRQM